MAIQQSHIVLWNYCTKNKNGTNVFGKYKQLGCGNKILCKTDSVTNFTLI